MLTKKDLSAIKEVIATVVPPIVNQIVDTKIKASEKRFESKIDEVKNEILQFKDEILGEIRSLRDEVAIVTGYKDQIEDHEVRLTKVEKHITLTSPPTL